MLSAETDRGLYKKKHLVRFYKNPRELAAYLPVAKGQPV
jgi:hypothetical protein